MRGQRGASAIAEQINHSARLVRLQQNLDDPLHGWHWHLPDRLNKNANIAFDDFLHGPSLQSALAFLTNTTLSRLVSGMASLTEKPEVAIQVPVVKSM